MRRHYGSRKSPQKTKKKRDHTNETLRNKYTKISQNKKCQYKKLT